jgi:alkanesulfonate monooxygenase
MPIQIIGLLNASTQSEETPGEGELFDLDHLRRFAMAYEAAGYDRVLMALNARSVEPATLAAYVSAYTSKLKFMIAHRPGFIAPTLAARIFATLDRVSNGRVGVHIITAANDAETRNDGDFLTKEQRYHRTREYVQVMKKEWESDQPFDHQGDHYRVEGGFAEVKPVQKPIPLFWGGSSELGVRYGAELADVFALGGGGIEQVAEVISTVKAEAAKAGRKLGFSMSMRLIVAPTSEAAWARANRIKEALQGQLVGRDLGEYGERRVAMAREVGKTNPKLFTDLTIATGGRTQIMSLVGSPAELVEGLMAYYDVGVDHFLITGFDPIADTEVIGRDIIPALRAAAAAREAEAARAVAETAA